MKKVSHWLFLSLFATLMFLAPMTTMAEDAPGTLSEEWLITVKPGYLGNFQEALKEHTAVRKKAGDPWNWQAYTQVVGENLDQVAIRHCCFNWADVDAYEQWNRSHPEVLQHWYAKVAPHATKAEHYFEHNDWTNSHWNDAASSYRLFGVTSWNVKGGSGGDFAAGRAKMSQIALNQGWANSERNWAWSTAIGGRNTESIVIPYKNYAAMAPGAQSFFEFLADQMGSPEAAAELMKSFSGASWGSSYTVWEHRPDLSMSDD